jgi:hypothetical protein
MSKQEKRLEAKKRKAEAFLKIASLNDEDHARMAKKSKIEVVEETGDETTKPAPPRLTSKPLVTGDSYEQLKAKLRERKNLLKSLPQFGLKAVGENASVEIPANLRTPLMTSDLQGRYSPIFCPPGAVLN